MAVIGVLALQGDFAEHIQLLATMGVEATEVRLPRDLRGIDALIIPGGESTTIVKLMDAFELTWEIKELVKEGMPTWGTCAGMIVLARELTEDRPKPLGLMDIRVRRNAFGRQVDSFESHISVPVLGGEPFPAVFIRAPVIEEIGPRVKSLAHLGHHGVVAAQEGHMMVTAFHPELTQDQRFHSYFVRMASGDLK
ncbi:MAG: pyridoxal 5'-phosphate synthase glutaminase subunit PdxT [Dehalococcoidia bacterium]|nr:pyridoxal 5'-phosphate synthase glutaminase subunit PdxT [Dehalococcoidia bacterium]